MEKERNFRGTPSQAGKETVNATAREQGVTGEAKVKGGARVIDFLEKKATKEAATPVETDDEGFLVHPEKWTRGFAESTAREVLPGELTGDHWKIIDYLRHYYSEYGAVPPVRILVKRTGIDAPYLRKLFPCGLINGACKIAGFPRNAVRGLMYP